MAYNTEAFDAALDPGGLAAVRRMEREGKAALAASLFQQLKSGGDWCALAKKYSKDPSSSSTCGKATFTQGQTMSLAPSGRGKGSRSVMGT